MGSLRCVDFLFEAGAFKGDSGHVTRATVDVPFPRTLTGEGIASGASYAVGVLEVISERPGYAAGVSYAVGTLA